MTVSHINHLSGGDATQATEIKHFYERVISDMITKAIEGSIKNIYLKNIRLHRGLYEWIDDGVLISNYRPTMLYLVLKIINPDKRIGVSNQKDEI